MVTPEKFSALALSFPAVEEKPHFEKKSFRVKNKIFATLSVNEMQGCLKLNEFDQSLFASHDPQVIFPVPNKWGKQGWTIVDLRTVKVTLLKAAVQAAYHQVATAKASTAKRRS